MTNGTDSDIKEIRELITGFSQKIEAELKELNTRVNELDKKVITNFNELDKKIITGFSEVDKKIITGFSEVDKKIEINNAYLDALDKRMANQEFIYRAVVIGIIATIATGVLRVLWVYPFNFS